MAQPADPIVDSEAELVERFPGLESVLGVGLDLLDTDLDWGVVRASGAAFLGCRLAPEAARALRGAGAVVVEPIDSVGFDPYRARLYTNDELMAGYVPGRPETTLDARVGALTKEVQVPAVTIARGIHDASIDAALTRFLDDAPGPVVGVMGSHSTPRGAPEYRLVATLGRELTRAGYVVATGGGPGLMEAANLGAWMAHDDDAGLDAAIAVLEQAPTYPEAPGAFLEAALDVRRRWPDGAVSLGVPTWLYVDEPLNQFSTVIAKYFQNSIRENGLLAIALGGVVFASGGIGTAQEIFTDAAQNGYTMYQVRSPMVFLGRDWYEHTQPAVVAALRAYAAGAGWEHLVRVVDSVPEVVRGLHELAPTEVPRPPCRLPLRHR